MQFGFATAADIRFGRGVSREAATLAATRATRALVVHGRSGERARWLLDALAAQGVATATVACPGEPDVAAAEAAVATARDLAPGIVIAPGGGAAIDLGKAVAALIPAQGPVLRYLEVVGEGRPLDAAPLPFIAIPTTAGTGAEVTKNAVIGVPEAGRKVSLRDMRMIPDIALVDPALTDAAPPGVTFPSGLDAITQVIEPFLSTKASPVTDALCRDAIPRGLRALFRLAEAEDAGARDDMALVSMCGGMALANAGLGAVHGLAGVIGGQTGAPHGEICATLLPHALAHNAHRADPGSTAAARIAAVEGWIGEALGTQGSAATGALASRIAALGIRDLPAMGLAPGDFDAVARAACAASSSRTNPVPLQADDFRAILDSAASR